MGIDVIKGKRFYKNKDSCIDGLLDLIRVVDYKNNNEYVIEDCNTNKLYEINKDDLYDEYISLKPSYVFAVRVFQNEKNEDKKYIVISINAYCNDDTSDKDKENSYISVILPNKFVIFPNQDKSNIYKNDIIDKFCPVQLFKFKEQILDFDKDHVIELLPQKLGYKEVERDITYGYMQDSIEDIADIIKPPKEIEIRLRELELADYFTEFLLNNSLLFNINICTISGVYYTKDFDSNTFESTLEKLVNYAKGNDDNDKMPILCRTLLSSIFQAYMGSYQYKKVLSNLRSIINIDISTLQAKKYEYEDISKLLNKKSKYKIVLLKLSDNTVYAVRFKELEFTKMIENQLTGMSNNELSIFLQNKLS